MISQVKNPSSATRSTPARTETARSGGLHATRVFVGMSGGVDSSVSAALLKEAGYQVTGVFIKVWTPPFLECTWKDDRLDAMRVCAKIGIPFITLDLEKEYKKEVVDYMITEYKAGRTPNPDVMCNKEVKFGAFYKWAIKNGADFVATGHYAQVFRASRKTWEAPNFKFQIPNKSQALNWKKNSNEEKNDRYRLVMGKDKNKDQSYFLWNLKQEQLAHVLFPIGHLEKPEVRKLAEKFGLITAKKKDSQGLCFLGKIDMKDFLKEFIEEKKGKVIDVSGKVIGFHYGAFFYTIGERHGFTVTEKTTEDKPFYIVSKDVKKNTLTASQNPAEDSEMPGRDIVKLKEINWTTAPLKIGNKVEVRLRYRQTLIKAKILQVRPTGADIKLEKPEVTITSGQSLVMYQGDVLVGGGIISE